MKTSQSLFQFADISDLWISVDDDGEGNGRTTECDELNNFWQPIIDASFANNIPDFESDPVLFAIEGIEYQYGLSAVDPDDDTLAYELISAPEGMVLTGQSLSWTPSAGQSGTHRVSLATDDGNGGRRSTFV